MKILLSRFITLWIIITLTFFIMLTLPGDPFESDQALPHEIQQVLRKHYGLDDSWYWKYGQFIKSIITWDFGPSLIYKDQSVNEIIKEGFSVSALLGIEAFLLSIGLGIGIGTWSALYAGKRKDKFILLLTSLGFSIPSFIIASLLQYFLSIKLGLFPIARWGTFHHTILPVLSLAALPTTFIIRMTRAGMIDVLQQGYIRAARARGISVNRLCYVHALRNALLPVITYAGPLAANMLVGSFVIEKIFAIPGLGQWFINSVINRDYPLIIGLTLFYSLLLLSFVAIVDMAYMALDPRIKTS